MAKSQAHAAVPFFNVGGGINTKFSKTSLGEDECEDLENFHLEGRGGIEKRSGYSLFGDISTPVEAIVGLWEFRIDNAPGTVVRIQNNLVEKWTGAAWSDITGAEVVTPGDNNLWNAITFRQNILMTNGVDIPLKWDGSGNVEKMTQTWGGDTITKAKAICLHSFRTVLGDVTYGSAGREASRVLGSDVGTLDTWTTVDFIDVNRGDGDSITCLLDVLGYLVVFKQNSLFRVTDAFNPITQVVKKVAPVGCPGPRAACVVGTMVFFLDTIGRVWAYDVRGDNEDSLLEVSREKLGPTTFDTFNVSRMQYAHLWHNHLRNEIYCFLTEGTAATETNLAWVYNVTTRGFSKHRYNDNFNTSTTLLVSGEPTLFVGTVGGLVMTFDGSLTDNGVTIPAYLLTRQQSLGDIGVIKGFRFIDIYTNSETNQDILVNHIIDFQSPGEEYTISIEAGGALWDSGLWDVDVWATGSDTITIQRLKSFGRWTQFRFTQANNEALKIMGYLLYVVPAGERRI